jgi:hypothetical protein
MDRLVAQAIPPDTGAELESAAASGEMSARRDGAIT